MRSRLGALVALVAVLLIAFGLDRWSGREESSGPSVAAPSPLTSSSASAVPPASSPTVRPRDPQTGLAWIDVAQLPREARQMIGVIEAGGPFRYAEDGSTFGNRQRLLPIRPAGFYREYTVPTPGESDRGARRIVTGDHDRQFFYTSDHYVTFARIRR